jgi:hypothetical protein
MKHLVAFLCVAMLLAAAAVPAMAAVNENFDAITTWGSYGNYDYNGFHLNNALTTATAAEVHGGTGKAVRLRNAVGSYIAYVGSDGLGKDGGVGQYSFWYRSYNGNSVTLKIVTTVNGVSVDSTGITFTSQTYTQFSRTINNSSDNIVIMVSNTAGVQSNIDDFVIEDYAPSGHETDAHIAAGGAGASATISSLVDTEPEAQVVMTFNVRDDGSGSMSENTIINGLVIGTGSANTTVATWAQLLAGAKLTDGTNTWTGIVTASQITFSGSPMTTLPDGGAWQTWSLKVWLKTTLPYNADNEILEFHVGPTSFTTDTSAAGFDPADAPIESGDLNNKIDIVATQLSITTQPPAVAIVNTNFTVRAGFTDVNGGIDEDWPSENITLSLNTGTGVLSSASGLTKASTSGQSAWTDLQYNTVENGVVLQAVSVTYAGPVLTDAFRVTPPPSIVADAYPTCWDGDNTDQAVPFAVHITIQNWAALANQQVYVKVYSGSYNPYHYTSTYGWSNLTNYDRKPIVTLDADGKWSGWLALKSSGMATFQPRAASVAGTSTNLTGTAISGTLLDLSGSGNGAILEDRDLSTLCPPGNIVAVRNLAGTIIGMWIAEDNGYPLDDGGVAIAPGGWRLAVCSFCYVPTIFESWGPGTWPGHGSPFKADTTSLICANPGNVVEVYDVILPVQLLSFSAVAGNGRVILRWETATETDNDHFEILRDGARLTTVRGAGTSASAHSYSWTDANVQNGTTYHYLLTAVDVNGTARELGTAEATPREDAGVVHEYALDQNYPNPFNPTTNIAFSLAENTHVTLSVVDLTGRVVAVLANEARSAGSYTETFDASHLASGVYFYQLKTDGFEAVRKMVLMR